MLVTLYTKPDCPPCDDVRRMLDRYAPQYGLVVNEVDILSESALLAAYGDTLPVVEIGDGASRRLVAPIEEAQLLVQLEIASRQALTGARGVRTGQVTQGDREPTIDRVVSAISRHWLRLVGITFGIFVGLPWLAPIFAALGWWGLADPIYTAYAVT